jgi:3-oxoacyl-[acyl-carrier protein] reductase
MQFVHVESGRDLHYNRKCRFHISQFFFGTHPVTAERHQELRSQTAVVTGSSGGIGQAIAEEFARAGAAVVIHGRQNRQAAESIACRLRAEGAEARVIFADLAESAGRKSLVEEAWSWRSGVQIWVNNAGADVLTGSNLSRPFEEKLESLWRVDVEAAIQLSRSVGGRMKAAGRGVLLNIGWDGADRGMPGDSGELFSTVKGAIMAFTRSLAQSLAPEVRVNCLAPGWIKTAWGARASEYWQSRAARECLRNRWGTPEDVARAARFLVSPAADFITGQIIPVNGGFNPGN